MMHNPAASGMGTIPAPVSSSYCVPYIGQFVIDQKVLTLSSGRFSIRDAQGTLLFDVKGKFPPLLHTKRILHDASGKAIVLLKKKVMTMHDKWTAYAGEDESESSLLFTMAKTSVFQLTPSFEVFLAANKSSIPDFTVKGNFLQHNYAILHGNTPIAEARKTLNVASFLIGKDQYGVTVYPGADHAFIASLVVIIDQVKQDDRGDSGGGLF